MGSCILSQFLEPNAAYTKFGVTEYGIAPLSLTKFEIFFETIST